MADTAPAGRAEALLEHADFVQRLARALCADEHRARDLVQDTWLAALRRPPRDGSRPRAWLAGVLRRLALQERRSEARRSAREEAAARGERQRSTGEIAAELEHQRRLGGAVLALPPAYREAILLRYYEALPARAVAERLGLPLETARTRLKRGRALLRERLDREWGGDRSAGAAALARLAYPAGAPALPALAGALAVGTKAKGALLLAAAGALLVTAWRLGGEQPAPPPGVSEPPGPAPSAEAGGPEEARTSQAGSARRPLAPEPAPGAESQAAGYEVEGQLVVVDGEGGEHRGVSGWLQLRQPGLPDAPGRRVLVAGGRFRAWLAERGPIAVVGGYTTDGAHQRPVLSDSTVYELPEEGVLEVRALWTPDSILYVRDALTGAELDELQIVTGIDRYGDRLHPGRRPSGAAEPARSPVRLPWNYGQLPYWVRAPGYAWGFVKIDHDVGGERELRLVRGGTLDVHLVGLDPSTKTVVRVLPGGAGERRVLAELAPTPEGAATFAGLPPGPYRVAAEIGRPIDPPVLLAEDAVELAAGATEAVVLELRPAPVSYTHLTLPTIYSV